MQRADMSGKFTYSPSGGIDLNAGTGIELKVTFVPNDHLFILLL